MFTIISPRVGTPGDKFEPSEDINTEALIEGGFIKSDKTPSKSAKTEETSTED
jgi:hypothetical protein